MLWEQIIFLGLSEIANDIIKLRKTVLEQAIVAILLITPIIVSVFGICSINNCNFIF